MYSLIRVTRRGTQVHMGYVPTIRFGKAVLKECCVSGNVYMFRPIKTEDI